jgi:prepilin-type N-terminal cleavage/methylation domain-containing protein
MNLNSRSSKGFTLIELLVVIAIIGIISAIVLVNLGAARSKGNDTSVRANLSNARSQAELFYYANGQRYAATAGDVTDMCAPGAVANGVKGVYEFLQSAANASGTTVNATFTVAGNYTRVTCHANAGSWVISAPLKTYQGMTQPMMCIDSTGKAVIKDVTGGGTYPASSAVICS